MGVDLELVHNGSNTVPYSVQLLSPAGADQQ